MTLLFMLNPQEVILTYLKLQTYLFYNTVGLWPTQERHCPAGWQRHLSRSSRIFEICEEQPTLWKPILQIQPGVHQSWRWPGEICLLRMRKVLFYKQMYMKTGLHKRKKNKPLLLKYPVSLVNPCQLNQTNWYFVLKEPTCHNVMLWKLLKYTISAELWFKKFYDTTYWYTVLDFSGEWLYCLIKLWN